MQLRLTRRALADLGLPSHLSTHPASDYVHAHDVVRGFVEQRGQNPTGQEWTHLPVTSAPVYNLHHGRYRGLTWHDEASDVVWLLGVGWHESGSRDDAYERLKARDEAGTLMPDRDDYLDLEASDEELHSFVSHVAAQAPELARRARAHPGTEVRDLIAERLDVGVLIDVVAEAANERLEDIWVAFAMPPRPGGCELPAYPEWLTVVLAALLPSPADLTRLQYGNDFPRPGGSRPNEIVVRWSSA